MTCLFVATGPLHFAPLLRRLVCDDAVAAGAAPEAVEAEFEKRLAKLVKRGAVASAADGKYMTLVVED